MSLIKSVSFVLSVALLASCTPAPQPQQPTDSASSAVSDASALAEISEDRAVMLLEAALQEHQIADLDCLGFASESDVPAGSKAAVWEFSAMEIHNETCGGDPAVSHVRDRYKVSSTGEVSVYDVAIDDYKVL